MATFIALLSTAGLFAMANAQSAAAPITTSLLVAGADKQPLAASVIGADRTATTYSINCPPGTDSNECGMGPGMTVTQFGTTAYAGLMSDPSFTYSWSCQLAGTTAATCVQSAGGQSANFPGVETTTLSASEISLFPVTITAGQTKLAAATAASTTTGHSSASTGAAALTASGQRSASNTGAAATPSTTPNAGSRVILGWAAVALSLGASAIYLC